MNFCCLPDNSSLITRISAIHNSLLVLMLSKLKYCTLQFCICIRLTVQYILYALEMSDSFNVFIYFFKYMMTSPSYISLFYGWSNGKILNCILHFFSSVVEQFVRQLLLVTEYYCLKAIGFNLKLILKLNACLKLYFMPHATTVS